MKKILLIILIEMAGIVYAQKTANRFFYELTYKPNKDSLKLEKEIMIIDIDREKSVYQSYDLVVSDSILNISVQKAMKAGQMLNMENTSYKSSQFSHRIFKYYPIKEIVYKENLFDDYYSYRENPEFHWVILNEKMKLETYNVQKAVTNFGDRKWIAWFTTEIPFQDGPYKFCGLPGLIIKIEDEDKNYSWELKGIRKIPMIKETSYIDALRNKTNTAPIKEITKEKFLEVYEKYKKDPFSEMRAQLSNLPTDVTMPDGSSINEQFRELERRTKEHAEKYNNRIEIPHKKN